MTTKSNKPKSPPTPSRPLGDAVGDVKKLYDEYSHATFAKAEIASKLGLSATSGPFAARLFTLKAFGLIVQNGNVYGVSETFKTLNSTAPTEPEFKRTALGAIRQSDTFRELLDDFKSKLPSNDAIASRLENQKRFNAARAKATALVLEKSLRFAGVLDSSNNILPVRDAGGSGQQNGGDGDGGGDNGGTGGTDDSERLTQDDPSADVLSLEIPVGEDRKVLVRYPRDLTADEAKKVGNVLNAVVA